MAEQGGLTAADIVERVAGATPFGPCVVALSGGADSAVAAWALVSAGRPVRAVFVDHGWPASERLGRAATEVGALLGIDVERRAAFVELGPSAEERARTARYETLDAASGSAEWIVTGHTADDQAETVLGNFLRGAGAGGLAGIPRRRGRIVRPLLDVTRAQTRRLAADLELPFFDDPDNDNRDLRRNAIRHDLIPYLESGFNPSLRRVLQRAADVFAADDRTLVSRADAVPIVTVRNGVKIPAAALTTLPRSVAARVARRALRTIGDGHAGRAADVAAVLAVAGGQPAQQVAGGATVVHHGPWVWIDDDAAHDVEAPSVSVPVPGVVDITRVRLRTWVETAPPTPWPLGSRRVVLDADAVSDPALRGARAGDGVALRDGTKRVVEALAEAGIRASARHGWPVLVSRGKLAWVVGVRAAAWARPGAGTRRYLWLDAEVEDR